MQNQENLCKKTNLVIRERRWSVRTIYNLRQSLSSTTTKTEQTVELVDRLGRRQAPNLFGTRNLVFGSDLVVSQFYGRLVQLVISSEPTWQIVLNKQLTTDLSEEAGDDNQSAALVADSSKSFSWLDDWSGFPSLTALLAGFDTVIILPHKDSRLTGSMNETYLVSPNVRALSQNLGGQVERRQLMIASLTVNEFLLLKIAASGKPLPHVREKVCCLKTTNVDS